MFEFLPGIVSLFHSNELLSMKVFLPCETPTNGISNFHHRRSHGGIEIRTFQALMLNALTTRPRIQLTVKIQIIVLKDPTKVKMEKKD